LSSADHPLFAADPRTLAELIRGGAAWLETHELCFGHGTDNALDESAWIALEACGLSPLHQPDYSMSVSAESLLRARQWYRRRVEERIPVPYLTGRCWFAGHEFVCDERALIPRSPLAELISQDFSPWLQQPPRTVLDLCCGGGCIAIAIAHQFADAQVHGADLSADALALAELNCRNHDLQQRMQWHCGDLYQPLPAGSRFDLIISNPPYVDQLDMDQLPAEYHHEPQSGLAAGPDGLQLVQRILADAPQFLEPDGWLIVETGNSADALIEHYPQLPFIWLDFEYGGDGVFALPASALKNDL